MKAPLLLRIATLLSCGMAFAGCDKEITDINPAPASVFHGANVLLPGQLNPLQVGDTWVQGPAATGLSCDVTMTLLTHRVTPNSEMDTWAGTVIGCIPAEKLVYNRTYTHIIEGDEYTYTLHAITETNGNISLATIWNRKSSR